MLDLNGDGERDLVWQHRFTLQLVQWHMDRNHFLGGQAFSQQLSPVAPGEPRWFVQAAGDMNGDGHRDLIFRREDGYVATWLLNGGTVLQELLLYPTPIGPEWRLVAAADMNNDGHTDLLWQRETDGLLSAWRMSGTTWTGQALTVADQAPNSWRIRAVGDLNGDGFADWVWHQIDGHVATWLMTWDGSAVRMATGGMAPPEATWVPDLTWQIVGRK